MAGKTSKKTEIIHSCLTAQRLRFCEEYIIDLNATQAAIRAGYSEKTATEQGSRLLTIAKVQQEIQRLKQERSKRTQINADNVVKELAKIGFSNIKQYLDIDGDEVFFKDIRDVPDDEAAAIESVKVARKIIKGKGENDDVEVQAIQFKLHNKENALEQLGKHLGIFENDNGQPKPEERQITRKELEAIWAEEDKQQAEFDAMGDDVGLAT